MKKLAIALVVALLAALAAPACLAEMDEEAAGMFCGIWTSPNHEKSVLEILPSYEVEDDEEEAEEEEEEEPLPYDTYFDVWLNWGDGGESEYAWYMAGGYDAGAKALVYTDGVMAEVTYSEEDDAVQEAIKWYDAEGALTLTDAGTLLWQDSREARAEEFEFERAPYDGPEAHAYVHGWFEPITAFYPGTAGGALGAAVAAEQVMLFIYDNELWHADSEKVRANLSAAWDELDGDARELYVENAPAVAAMVNDALADYSAVSGQFADAGAGEDMEWMVDEIEAILGWRLMEQASADLGN